MSAVIVHNAYKRFGAIPTAYKKLPPRRSTVLEASLQPVVAVDHISFTVEPGEIFGVLGLSSSGKSTLIRLLATLLQPDAGDIRIFGYDAVTQPLQVQRLINRVSGEASFYKKLSAVDNLEQAARRYGMGGTQVRSRAVEVLTRLGLSQAELAQPIEHTSRSAQQKASIAHALMTRARLILLDEPARDLDAYARYAVLDLLRELRDQQGATIVFTTRDLVEAESICDRIAVLQEGRLVALDTPANLKLQEATVIAANAAVYAGQLVH